MPFKFIILSAFLAAVSAGYSAPVHTHYSVAPTIIAKVDNTVTDAVASTHQNVVRSFGGTVSQYSKSVNTPYSSVHKEDRRVNNNIYTPAIAKTITYSAPVAEKSVSYSPAPASHAFYTTHSNPDVAKTVYAHQEPTRAIYASSAPQTIYTKKQPVHDFYASPAPTTAGHTYQNEVPATTTYNQSPAATTYTHTSPKISAYGSRQTVHYSPAEMVSHVSFDGFGTHWGS